MPLRFKSICTFALLLMVMIGTVAAQTPSATPLVPDAPAEATPDPSQVEILMPEIISTRPHDTRAWTEGFLLKDGFLYESVGETGNSSVRKVDPQTGKIVQQYKMDADDYAEGIAIVGDKLFQLTYKQETVYHYNWQTFEKLPETFSYKGEGWGLAYDGDVLWMSNGAPALTKRDSKTFDILEELPITIQGLSIETVSAGGYSLGGLNELEVVGGTIYANIWPTTYILRIDKATGFVTGVIDGSTLLPADAPIQPEARQYLNGIAYDPETETFLITGKYWPYTFEVTWKSVGVLPPLQ